MSDKELSKRIFTWIGLSIIITILLYFSNNKYVLATWTALLCAQSLFELFHATGFQKNRVLLIGMIILGISISFISFSKYSIFCFFICPLTVVFFLILMIKKEKFCKFSSKSSLIFPSLLIIFQLQAIREIRFLTNGLYYLAFVILVCTFTDTFAYIVGKRFGKHKIAPKISPNKTWEGAIGGVIITTVLIVLLAAGTKKITNLTFNYAIMILYILLLSLTSQFGDFSMSAIKRITGIKDFGKLLPGHGGILDRFDSWLLTFPAAYILCYYSSFMA